MKCTPDLSAEACPDVCRTRKQLRRVRGHQMAPPSQHLLVSLWCLMRMLKRILYKQAAGQRQHSPGIACGNYARESACHTRPECPLRNRIPCYTRRDSPADALGFTAGFGTGTIPASYSHSVGAGRPFHAACRKHASHGLIPSQRTRLLAPGKYWQ